MSEIKALETSYHGFLFRSRLEARWAMFYDRVGVTWAFEPQPVLVGGEPYLPDFMVTLNDRQIYHEVKPNHESHKVKPVRVYLAGKIGRSAADWRGEDAAATQEGRFGWTAVRAEMAGAVFLRTGPFVECMGHGYIDRGDDEVHATSGRRREVLDRCKSAIHGSDMICAHLGSRTAYGTLVEIGFAHAAEIPVFLTIARSLLPKSGAGHHDFWFAETMSRESLVVDNHKAARDWHASIINRRTSREWRLIAGIGGHHHATLTFGDPYEVAMAPSGSSVSFRGGEIVDRLCRENVEAARAVREHRFDRRA